MKRVQTRPQRSLALRFSLLAVLVAQGAFAAAPATETADADTVTWAADVAPILYQSCVGCHRPGQVAPMSLLTYDQARPWGKAIARAAHDRAMPPWFANPEHGKFVEDPRLTDAQIDTINRWVKSGMPAGDLSQAPPQPTFSSEWLFGEPDDVFTAEPYQVSDDVEDHYQWLAVENPIDEERWIKAIEVRPGFPEVVHHQLTYLGPPGATIEGVQGAGRIDLAFVGGWGPGVAPLVFPEGYGMKMPAGSTIFFQMHYHKTPGPGTGGIDQTKIGLKFYDQKPENVMETLWLVDPALNIPPGEANYQSTSWIDLEHDAILFDYTPHMHLRGKSMVFTADYKDGKQEILLDVPRYDFDWQLSYTPVEPKILPAGTRLGVKAVFDNSADNPDNPDPAATVRFGEKTTDEMMVGFIHYTYVDKTKQVDMPTFVVPEALKQQMEQIRKLRQQQREGAGAAPAAPTSGAAAFEGKKGS
jgi:mono/diheme cytochrome c family protein